MFDSRLCYFGQDRWCGFRYFARRWWVTSSLGTTCVGIAKRLGQYDQLRRTLVGR